MGISRDLKRLVEHLVYAIIVIAATSSCEDYLDVDSGSLGLSEEEIFTEFTQYRKFLDKPYDLLARVWDGRKRGSELSNVSSRVFPSTLSDQLRSQDKSATEALLLETGFVEARFRENLWQPTWEVIRITNIAIANHYMLEEATQAEKDGLLGQAYMARALAYEFLLEVWGGMPHIVEPTTAEKLDYARESYYRTCLNIAMDCDSAAKYLPVRWDAGATISDDGYAESDFLASSDTRRFTSVLALGLKSRALLYAASPFAQESKAAEDTKSQIDDWQAAAVAANEAIVMAESNGYRLMSEDNLTDNFFNVYNNAEALYTIPDGQKGNQHSASGLFGTFSTPFALTQRTSELQCAVFATHDIAERFEAVEYENGEIISAKPIVTFDASGRRIYHGNDPDMADIYNEQNPYNDPTDYSSELDPVTFAKPNAKIAGHEGYGRDPRFYKFMIYHGRAIDRWGKSGVTWDDVLKVYGGGHLWENFTDSRLGARRFDMSVGSYDLKQIQSPTYDNTTGYYTGKFWSLGVNNILGSYTRMHHPYPILRVAELYLNYAEAANQAYGGPGGAAPNAVYTAEGAVNVIRARVGMPNVDVGQFSSKEAFHDRIFNERCVELCFESNHPFVDVRRWKLLASQDYREVYAMKIVPDETGNTSEYPTGYVFTPTLLETKPYASKYYLSPIIQYDVERSIEFLQNPGY
ncbi:MAG: RagB/SusD family nutrient uptake outer membrane protein [Cyclobacteriaceae bacterium]